MNIDYNINNFRRMLELYEKLGIEIPNPSKFDVEKVILLS